MYFYVIIALVIGIDQWVKYYIRTHMTYTESIPLIHGVLNLTFIKNPGAAFGILEGKQWFFVLSTLAVIVAAVYYQRKGEFKHRPLMGVGVALLVGGAIGNAIDRVLFGLVTDFFDLQFVQFAIFNVADVAINIGVVLMAIAAIFGGFGRNKEKREQAGK